MYNRQLHYAAAGGHTAVARALLRRAAAAGTAGALARARGGPDGWLPIHEAAAKGYHGVIAVLLSSEANAATPATRAQGALAARGGGGDEDELRRLGLARAALDSVATVHARSTQRGDSPLHLAARHGHVNVIEYLLANGADPEAKDKQGKTPLGLAQDPPRGFRVDKAKEVIKAFTAHGILK